MMLDSASWAHLPDRYHIRVIIMFLLWAGVIVAAGFRSRWVTPAALATLGVSTLFVIWN